MALVRACAHRYPTCAERVRTPRLPDLPIGDQFKYNVNPLFMFTARTIETAVVAPLVLLHASPKLLPMALFGTAAYIAHLLVFPVLFHYARRFHMYARPDTLAL